MFTTRTRSQGDMDACSTGALGPRLRPAEVPQCERTGVRVRESSLSESESVCAGGLCREWCVCARV